MGDIHTVQYKAVVAHHDPSRSSKKTALFHNQQKLIELERSGKWMLVSTPKTGLQGWVRTAVFGLHSRNTHPKATVPHGSNKHKSIPSVIKPSLIQTKVSYKRRGTPRSRDFSLLDEGLIKGIKFDGVGRRSKTVYFPSPIDSSVSSGAFTLRYRASTLMVRSSNLRITINDVPVKTSRIITDGAFHKITALLLPSMFRRQSGFVKVNIQVNMIGNEDRCIDEREGNAFVYISAESSLHVAYASQLRSVRDYWRMLPHIVKISLPAGTIPPQIFKSALSLMIQLDRAGKKVETVRLPNLGNIVVANKKQIKQSIKKNISTHATFERLAHVDYPGVDDSSNISLVGFHQTQFLAITEPFDTNPFYLLDAEWNRIAAEKEYQLFPASYSAYLSNRTLPASETFEVPISNIGINTKVQRMFRSTSWQATVGPNNLPAGSRMSAVMLDFVSPINKDPDGHGYKLYVYINDIMVRAISMDNEGEKQSATIKIPAEFQQQFNTLTFVAEHEINIGDCHGNAQTSPFQILPSSKVLVERVDAEPSNFNVLTYYLAGGFDTYIEHDYLKNAAKLLYLLTRVVVDLSLPLDMERFHFNPKGTRLDPKKPFLAVGAFDINSIRAPVRFDHGRVTVLDESGNTMLDVKQLLKLTIMQVGHAENATGLLINPGKKQQFLFPEQLVMQPDDVAFIDNNGVVLSLSSKDRTLVKIDYLDVKTWFEMLGAYRFWIFALFWFLFISAVMYLYTMSHKNKKRINNEYLMDKDAEDKIWKERDKDA
ncbi:MAG: cellulose biosynthesis cyclic di-GMP-binding regulatory protein BcsB, partial [Mariprofundaceae bacterium]|nr:cellulose biosynthesis cyclic di-GMP-binding regulatory protein BcsB [Mariprofundaceae bacterium]